ncbi:MAG: hypothetical protein HC809_09095, partial [Gammaproteobacteria bacterium]|nr:hypothetical protein [Gammaproteobacteria bacterium]
MPGNRTGQIRRALPFAVEEYLAGDLEAMHIATGPIVRNRAISVVVVDRMLLSDWLAALKHLGLTPGIAVVDASLLRGADHEINVLFDQSRVLLGARGHALSLDRDSLPGALAAAVGASTVEQTVEFINGTLGDIAKAEIGHAAPAKITFTESETEVPALQTLAQRFGRAAWVPVNILSGEFAPARPRNVAWQRWRGVAALIA